MFEAIVTLCLIGAPDVCRDVLIPGFEGATCSTALVPSYDGLTSKGPHRCVETGHIAQVEEIAPGVFVHEGLISDITPESLGDLSNSGFIIGENTVAVIDTGGSRIMGERLYRAIRAQTDKPISHVVLTHMHPDHILGASVFTEVGAKVVGHALFDRALADRAQAYGTNYAQRLGQGAYIGTGMPNIDTPVQDRLEIDLGNRILELQAWRLAHTGADVTVYDRTTKTLFTGDLIFHRHAPALDGSLRGWQATLNDMLEIPALRIVPGHGNAQLAWPEGVRDLQRYLDVLAKDSKAAIEAGTPMGQAITEIGEGERANWDLFDLFNPRNATVAYSELEWE